MKSEPDLTLKEVKPRSNFVNFDILRASRQLFAVKYSQLISSDTFVINLDETLINRNIKNSNSWSKKVYPEEEAKNTSFVGSVNWKIVILWNGNWFSMFSSTTSNSNKFASFLDKLNFWLSANKYLKRKKFLFYNTIEANTKQCKFYKNLKKWIVI